MERQIRHRAECTDHLSNEVASMIRRRATRARGGRPLPEWAERGAVLVEAAFVFPLLILLLFGIIDFGAAYNNSISVRQGARDGMRQAIVNTKPTAPSGGWSCPIVGATAASGSDAQALICYTKARVGLNASDTRVKVYFTAPFTAGQPVKVCVQYKLTSTTGAFGLLLNNRVLQTEVESLIETDEPTFTAPVAETPITSWNASCSTL